MNCGCLNICIVLDMLIHIGSAWMLKSGTKICVVHQNINTDEKCL